MRHQSSGITNIHQANTDQHNDENRDLLEYFIDHRLRHLCLSFEIIILVTEMWTWGHLTSSWWSGHCYGIMSLAQDEPVLHHPRSGPDHVLNVSMVLWWCLYQPRPGDNQMFNVPTSGTIPQGQCMYNVYIHRVFGAAALYCCTANQYYVFWACAVATKLSSLNIRF